MYVRSWCLEHQDRLAGRAPQAHPYRPRLAGSAEPEAGLQDITSDWQLTAARALPGEDHGVRVRVVVPQLNVSPGRENSPVGDFPCPDALDHLMATHAALPVAALDPGWAGRTRSGTGAFRGRAVTRG